MIFDFVEEDIPVVGNITEGIIITFHGSNNSTNCKLESACDTRDTIPACPKTKHYQIRCLLKRQKSEFVTTEKSLMN